MSINIPTSIGQEDKLQFDNSGNLKVTGTGGGGIADLQIRNASNTWTDVGYFTGNATLPFNLTQIAGTNVSSSLYDVANTAIKVNVVAGGGGGGVAQLQVRSGANAWTDVGYAGGDLNVPISIADGSNIAEGATTDAAITSDTTGTISGKLRGLVKILSSVWDSVGSRLKIWSPDATATGTINALNGTVTLALDNRAAVAIDVRGTWVGTISFLGSTDGTNYVPIWGFLAGDQQIYESISGSQSNNIYRFTTAGFVSIQVKMTAYTSGTATISMRTSETTSGVYINFPLVMAQESTSNSTTTPLGANGVFTGPAEDLLNYVGLLISVYSDQSSATNGLAVQFSPDGTNWDEVTAYTVIAATTFTTFSDSDGRYFRIVYTNGTTPQTVFRLKTIKRNIIQIGDVNEVSTPINDTQCALLTRSVIVGKTTGGGGGYVSVKVNPSGTLTADVSNSTNVGVTGTFWQTTQPVSWSGQTVTVTQSTGTNLHTVLDSGTLTSITNAVITNADTTIGGTTAPSKLFLIGGKTTDVTPQYQPLPLTNSGAAVKVDGSAITQPVSWSGQTVTVTQGTGTNLHTVVDSGSITVSQGTGTNLHTVLDSGTLTSITNTVTVGQATGSNLHTVLDSGTLTSITNAVITNADTAIGGTTAPSKLFLIGGKTTDVTPQYQPLPLTNSGTAVKVDGSGVTQPVSWSGQTVTVTQSTGTNLHAVIDSGTVSTITNPVTVAQATAANLNATVTGTITANQGGTWNINTLTGITNNVNVVGTQSDNSANSSAKLPTIPARANASAPTWTEGNEVPLSADLAGNLRTIGSGNYTVVQGTGTNLHAVIDSGTITSNQGTPTTAANAWPTKFTDGTNLITAGDNTNNAIRVNVVAGGAGGGVADTQVRNSSNNWTDVGYYSGNLNMPVQGTIADDTLNSNIGAAKLPTLPAVAHSFQGVGAGTDGYAVPLNVDRDGTLRVTGEDFKTMNQLLFMMLNELMKMNKGLSHIRGNETTH